MECKHDVSAMVGKPCLDWHLTAEPTGAMHLWLTTGTEDQPDGTGCTEFGPFDSIGDVCVILRMHLQEFGVRRELFLYPR